MSREDAIHQKTAASYPDRTLEGIYQDLKKLNLRDYSNNETRWKGGRLKAVAAVRRSRKQAKTYNP